LLVVIAVIALLLGLLVPALQKARRQARTAACQMHLRQWGTTLAAFVEDNEGRLLRDDSLGRRAMAGLWILTGRSIAETTNDHLQAPRRYHPVSTKGMLCPEATKPGDGSTGKEEGGWGNGDVTWDFEIKAGATNRAWIMAESGGSAGEVRVSKVSYGLNGWLFDPLGKPASTLERFMALKTATSPSYTNLFTLRRTTSVPLLFDCAYYYGLPTDECSPPMREEETAAMGDFCMNRHNGYVNGLFLDWSVRKVGLKELWTFKWYESFNTANEWTKAGGVQPEDWPPWMRNLREY